MESDPFSGEELRQHRVVGTHDPCAAVRIGKGGLMEAL
jgi:hypothetical protein